MEGEGEAVTLAVVVAVCEGVLDDVRVYEAELVCVAVLLACGERTEKGEGVLGVMTSDHAMWW